MLTIGRPLYSPALRMKTGELTGIRDLASDVADCLALRLIVPPPAERDEELQNSLFPGDQVPTIGSILSRYWRDRDAFIEPTYLIDDFGRDRVSAWLPRMFELARKASVRAIPLFSLKDFSSLDKATVKASFCDGPLSRFGVVLSSADLIDREAIDSVCRVLDAVKADPSECSIFADFHDADFTEPTLIAPIISAAFELLQEAALWRHVIFQGTNFPEKNLAQPDSHYRAPRNEWKAWRLATRFDQSSADQQMFGDYAADCAKLVFGTSGGAAIRHYRYTTGEEWIIERGKKAGKDSEIMREVCNRIILSKNFAGRDFSRADDFIYRTAKGLAGPGNATIWRAINTTHHITRVVADIGERRGVQIAKAAVSPLYEQSTIF